MAVILAAKITHPQVQIPPLKGGIFCAFRTGNGSWMFA